MSAEVGPPRPTRGAAPAGCPGSSVATLARVLALGGPPAPRPRFGVFHAQGPARQPEVPLAGSSGSSSSSSSPSSSSTSAAASPAGAGGARASAATVGDGRDLLRRTSSASTGGSRGSTARPSASTSRPRSRSSCGCRCRRSSAWSTSGCCSDEAERIAASRPRTDGGAGGDPRDPRAEGRRRATSSATRPTSASCAPTATRSRDFEDAMRDRSLITKLHAIFSSERRRSPTPTSSAPTASRPSAPRSAILLPPDGALPGRRRRSDAAEVASLLRAPSATSSACPTQRVVDYLLVDSVEAARRDDLRARPSSSALLQPHLARLRRSPSRCAPATSCSRSTTSATADAADARARRPAQRLDARRGLRQARRRALRRSGLARRAAATSASSAAAA